MGVSLKPSDAVKGGGLLDDEDVRVVESKFVMFDYGGSVLPSPALMWKLDTMDGSELIPQYWSMGSSKDWIPSDDGKELVAIGRRTQLIDDCNGMILLSSLINAGFPESKIADDISIFEGLECHVNRVAAPERKGLTKKKENQTILTVSKVHKLPWEKDSTKKKSAGSGAGAGTGSGSSNKKSKPKKQNEDSGKSVEEVATEFLLNLLADDERMSQYPDGIPKAKLAPEACGIFPAGDPIRSAVVQLIFKGDDFLKSGPWVYEGGKVSMG
jgi:hypothetical protein